MNNTETTEIFTSSPPSSSTAPTSSPPSAFSPPTSPMVLSETSNRQNTSKQSPASKPKRPVGRPKKKVPEQDKNSSPNEAKENTPFPSSSTLLNVKQKQTQTVSSPSTTTTTTSSVSNITTSLNSSNPPKAFFLPVTVDPKKIYKQGNMPTADMENTQIIKSKPYIEALNSNKNNMDQITLNPSPIFKKLSNEINSSIIEKKEKKVLEPSTSSSSSSSSSSSFGGRTIKSEKEIESLLESKKNTPMDPWSFPSPSNFDQDYLNHPEKFSKYIQSEKYEKDTKRFFEFFSDDLKSKNSSIPTKEKEDQNKKLKDFIPTPRTERSLDRAREIRERAHLRLFNELPKPLLKFDPKSVPALEEESYDTEEEDMSYFEKEPTPFSKIENKPKQLDHDISKLKDQFKDIQMKSSQDITKKLEEKPSSASISLPRPPPTSSTSSTHSSSSSNHSRSISTTSSTTSNPAVPSEIIKEEKESKTDTSGHTGFVLIPDDEPFLFEKETITPSSLRITSEMALRTLKNPLVKALLIFILFCTYFISSSQNGDWKSSPLVQLAQQQQQQQQQQQPLKPNFPPPIQDELETFSSFRLIHHFSPMREPISQYSEVDRIFEEEEEQSFQSRSSEYFHFVDMEQDVIMDGNEAMRETGEETRIEGEDVFELDDIFNFHFRVLPSHSFLSLAYFLLYPLNGKKSERH